MRNKKKQLEIKKSVCRTARYYVYVYILGPLGICSRPPFSAALDNRDNMRSSDLAHVNTRRLVRLTPLGALFQLRSFCDGTGCHHPLTTKQSIAPSEDKERRRRRPSRVLKPHKQPINCPPPFYPLPIHSGIIGPLLPWG